VIVEKIGGKTMSKIGIFMADGCEEIEGLTVVDIARRGGLDITMISITGKKEVKGSHGITFFADALKDEIDYSQLDGIVLPGGMPGTLNLGADDTVNTVIKNFAAEGKLVCAICAAPSVLGTAGILKGKHATCHPGFEEKLTGAVTEEKAVVADSNIITSRGMGTAIPFGLEIVRYFAGDEAVETIRKGLVYA
jgi:4-methyl-5(b-hydroxyethyl)-thiazole monophosphate biosynthesis